MNKIFCSIGIIMALSSIYFSFINEKDEKVRDFFKLLNDKQKKEYGSKIKERRNIYITGMILGLIMGLVYYLYNPKDKYLFCTLLTIMSSVKLGFYQMYPKSKLMIYSLTEKQQTDAWADVYTEMKNKWHYSFIIGIVGYIFLSLAYSK
tara:strand:- start:304 stop:750 length:447 start_codon:yes stop_codon:yes gene_type:complete